ncbi:MAG: CRISPR-associated endonuclease Cas6 [Candidatus Neomarinimicrobiota bacterium]|nr:CRISPR-associated endonuclease Cas6 [Candidatus Neomarinimicrobiota bacterium]
MTDKPVKKTPYQVKGVFIRNFSSYDIVPMLNGKYRDRYLYPRVQVKVINEKIFITGVGHGVKPVLQLIDNIKQLDFGNIKFDILEKRVDENKNIFDYKDETVNYQFLTSWAALNKNSWKIFKNMESEDKVNFLNKLLEKNLAFISNELKLTPPKKFLSMIKVNSIEPDSIDDNKWGTFNGVFKTNFNLPSFIGLGNGITRGYGTLLNADSGQLINKDDLGLQHSDENKFFESDLDEIQPDDFNKLNLKQDKRSHRLKRKKRKRSKNFNNGNYIDNQKKDSEPNFNTELYHQKQHKV